MNIDIMRVWGSQVQLLAQVVIHVRHLRMPGEIWNMCLKSFPSRDMSSVLHSECCKASPETGRSPARARARNLAHHLIVPACWAPCAAWACPRLPAQQRAAG